MKEPLINAARGAVLIFIGGLISLLLGLASKIVVANNTTKEDFGLYSLLIAIISVFTLFATLGIHEGITRHVSVSLGENRNEDASAMARASQYIGLVSGSVFFLILFTFSDFIAHELFRIPHLAYPLKVISFYIPISVLIQINIGILRGRGFIRPQVFQGVGQSLVFLCVIGIFFLLRFPFISVIYAYLFSAVAAFMMTYCFGKEGAEYRSFLLRNVVLYRHHYVSVLKFSYPLLVVNMTGVVLSWADSIILGMYAGATDVGSYNVSMTLARILEFPTVALAFVFMPIAGDLYARRQLAELKKTYQTLTKWLFFATLPFFFILFCFSEITIRLIFGDQFMFSALPLRILSVGFMSSAFWGVNGVLLVVLGMSRALIVTNILGMVLNVVLNIILIKVYGYGVIGAATASMISIILMNLMASALIYRENTIHPLRLKYVRSIAGSVAVALLLLYVSSLFPAVSWLLPVYLFLFIAGSLGILVVTKCLDHEDAALLEAVLARVGVPKKYYEKWL